MEPGVIHIVARIDGILGMPPDTEWIIDSLKSYARRRGIVSMQVLDKVTGDLGEWRDMVEYAHWEYRVLRPVVVGIHGGDRVLVGVVETIPDYVFRLPDGHTWAYNAEDQVWMCETPLGANWSECEECDKAMDDIGEPPASEIPFEIVEIGGCGLGEHRIRDPLTGGEATGGNP